MLEPTNGGDSMHHYWRVLSSTGVEKRSAGVESFSAGAYSVRIELFTREEDPLSLFLNDIYLVYTKST